MKLLHSICEEIKRILGQEYEIICNDTQISVYTTKPRPTLLLTITGQNSILLLTPRYNTIKQPPCNIPYSNPALIRKIIFNAMLARSIHCQAISRTYDKYVRYKKKENKKNENKSMAHRKNKNQSRTNTITRTGI